MEKDMIRYSVITEKNPREIVLLRGSGCRWRRCRFCDYHLDFSSDSAANFRLNQQQLNQVTGKYRRLEVINSGSFTDLDETTMAAVKDVCLNKGIKQLHFECHWNDRAAIAGLRRDFSALNIAVKLKIGVETFDALFRESYLVKGMDGVEPAEIAAFYDECCLLFGLPGQTRASMEKDIRTGLAFFERVCINIMEENTAPIKPDPAMIDIFKKELFPLYKDEPRVDILLQNTGFGVGGCLNGGENRD